MRWSLALPLVSAGALPAVLDPAVTLPGGLSPVVLPGTAVAGAIACLLVAGLATAAGAAPTFAASVFVVAVAASATVAQASIGGAATRPILVDVLLALVTTGFVARWARRDPDSGPERSYLPRGRFVFAVLVVVSGGLGAWAVLR
jgi:hypothetical protein